MTNTEHKPCCNNPQLMPIPGGNNNQSLEWCMACQQRVLNGKAYSEKEWDEYFQGKIT